MRVVIIGGTGHVGTYLVPYLVDAGHEVINLSRQQRKPYKSSLAWENVRNVFVDRNLEEAAGSFYQRVIDMRPDIVIDMICFKVESARLLVEALRGHIQHFLSCGTIWVHGPSAIVPTTEEQPRHPFGEYGIQKAAIEYYLLEEARRSGFPATILHPGHIVGPGWLPINPVGNNNPLVFEKLAHGDELALPNLGSETLHHVHADDVARVFMKAIANWSTAVGESFHVVSPSAMTLRGYAEAVADWFGQTANLRYLSWDEWRDTVSEEESSATWDHIAHSPNCSIAKAQRMLDYHPRYTSLQAIFESVEWLIQNGKINV